MLTVRADPMSHGLPLTEVTQSESVPKSTVMVAPEVSIPMGPTQPTEPVPQLTVLGGPEACPTRAGTVVSLGAQMERTTAAVTMQEKRRKPPLSLTKDTWPSMRDIEQGLHDLVRATTILSHSMHIADLLPSEPYLSKFAEAGYYVDVTKTVEYKTDDGPTKYVEEVVASHGNIDPLCPPGILVDVRKFRQLSNLQSNCMTEEAWSTDSRQLLAVFLKFKYKQGFKEFDSLIEKLRRGEQRPDDCTLFFLGSGGGATTAGAYRSSGGKTNMSKFFLENSQDPSSEMNIAMSQVFAREGVFSLFVGSEFIPENYPVPECVQNVPPQYRAIYLGKWVGSHLIYAKDDVEEMAAYLSDLENYDESYARSRLKFHYKFFIRPWKTEEKVLAQYSSAAASGPWQKRISVSVNDNYRQIRMETSSPGKSCISLDPKHRLTGEDLLSYFFAHDHLLGEFVDRTDAPNAAGIGNNEEGETLPGSESNVGSLEASMGNQPSLFSPTLQEVVVAAARQAVAGCYRFRGHNIDELAQQSIPLFGNNGFYRELGFMLRSRPLTMPFRPLDVTTGFFIICSGILTPLKDRVDEGGYMSDSRLDIADCTHAEFDESLIFSVLLRVTGRVSPILDFYQWNSSMNEEKRQVPYVIGRQELPVYITFLRLNLNDDDKVTQLQGKQMKGAIPSRLQVLGGLLDFFEDLQGSDFKSTADRMWQLSQADSHDHPSPMEGSIREEAVRVINGFFSKYYDIGTDTSIKRSCTFLASQVVADLEEITRDPFGPVVQVHSGSGAEEGLKHIRRALDPKKDLSGKGSVDNRTLEAMLSYFQHDSYVTDELLACQGLYLQPDGEEIVISLTGRPVTLKEMESLACEVVHRVHEAVGGTRSISQAQHSATFAWPIRHDINIANQPFEECISGILDAYERIRSTTEGFPLITEQFMTWTEKQLVKSGSYEDAMDRFDASKQAHAATPRQKRRKR